MPRALSDLRGRTVVLTRRREDNAVLAAALRARGAEVIELPCIRSAALGDRADLVRSIRSLREGDVLVLTSRAGADAVAAAADAPVACPVAAVGEATAARARALGMRVAFVASRAASAALGRELPLPSGEVVLARSDLADGELPEALRARGARVREVVAYRTVAEVAGDADQVGRALDRGPVAILLASPSAVDALVAAVGAGVAGRAALVAIGPRTARHIRRTIGARPIVARATDPAALVRAIASAHAEEVVS